MKKQKINLNLQEVHDAFNTAYQFVKQHSEIENNRNYWDKVWADYSDLCRNTTNSILPDLLNVSYAYLVKQGMEILTKENKS